MVIMYSKSGCDILKKVYYFVHCSRLIFIVTNILKFICRLFKCKVIEDVILSSSDKVAIWDGVCRFIRNYLHEQKVMTNTFHNSRHEVDVCLIKVNV